MGVAGAQRFTGRFDASASSKVRSFGGGGFIPVRRGFFAPPKLDIKLIGDWNRAARTMIRLAERYERALDRAVNDEARYFQRLLIKGLISQAPGGQRFAPLAASTIVRRASRGITSTQALIRTGEMMQAIRVHRIAKGAYFTGIHHTARGYDGRPLSHVAMWHEDSNTYPKQPANFPSRPFFGPIMAQYGNPADVKRRFRERLNGHLARDLGFGFYMGGVFGSGIAVRGRGQSGRSRNVGSRP